MPCVLVTGSAPAGPGWRAQLFACYGRYFERRPTFGTDGSWHK